MNTTNDFERLHNGEKTSLLCICNVRW